ncbi:hypothetical protein B9N43_07230 [Denitratisoma sp. DHT3]|uniref:RrF2 family transcriptional regulator n=1 Tax=Denitratisoma sp. DHT3 TaxID=1981880 RepID=UPI001198A762|nr:Rrf2 family transcriptional regulator [Denitratisoma sp. DHT3]QDX81055.1 hypothetical protein B9N43_07230 [Denitratisoma sp. DHT3]
MQLTRFTDYALRVLTYLAYRGDELATIGEISASYDISHSHLMKIVQHLGRLGYVTTLRGKGGGLKLARAPQDINLGDVVRHTEETLDVMECLADDYVEDCQLFKVCKLKMVLQEAQQAFLACLDERTLQDLLTTRSPFSSIEFHPRPTASPRA